MSKKEIRDRILNDKKFTDWWSEGLSSGHIESLLRLCELERGRFSSMNPPDPRPHIQSENNGGMRAWFLLSKLMMTPDALMSDDKDRNLDFELELFDELRGGNTILETEDNE